MQLILKYIILLMVTTFPFPNKYTFCYIGTTFLDEHHDKQKALQYWRAACDLRERFEIQKKIPTTNNAKLLLYYRNAREFKDRNDLEAIALDVDDLRLQSLLICERVLGPKHKDMIYRLMYRGAAYADSLQFQHCIDLWRRALELRVEKDTILFCDTCFTAQALVKLFLDLYMRNRGGLPGSQKVRLEDVISTIELLVRGLGEGYQLLDIHPQFKRQLDSYNTVLKIITHLLHLLTCILPNSSTLKLPDSAQIVAENDDPGMQNISLILLRPYYNIIIIPHKITL